MKSTFSVLFYLKRDKQKVDGTIPVFCRITIDGKATRFNTKASINSVIWDVKIGKAIGKTAEAMQINNLLDSIKVSLYNIYHELQGRSNNASAEHIKNTFLGIESKSRMFLDMFKRHNEDLRKLIGISISKGTCTRYEATCTHLTNFIKKRYNLSDIALNEINHQFIQDFDTYLRINYRFHQNTVAKYMQRFKTIMIIARNNEYIYNDPFTKYKLHFEKVDRGYLTQNELEIIMQKEFSTKRLEQVRDIFIFSCYTGLAYIDVYNLREKHIRTSFDGNWKYRLN